MIERVAGPVNGYFVAAYACPVGELGDHYVAYYKLFKDPPESFWDENFLAQGVDSALHESAEEALDSAFDQASVGAAP